MNIEWQSVPALRQQMMPRPQKGLSLVSQPKRKLVQKDYLKVMELHVNREYKLNNSYDGLIFCVLYVCGLKKIKSRLDMSLTSCFDIISVLFFFLKMLTDLDIRNLLDDSNFFIMSNSSVDFVA